VWEKAPIRGFVGKGDLMADSTPHAPSEEQHHAERDGYYGFSDKAWLSPNFLADFLPVPWGQTKKNCPEASGLEAVVLLHKFYDNRRLVADKEVADIDAVVQTG
jgi:hypothetical protein